MAKTEHYYTQFETDRFYHVYNRTVEKKPLFKNEGNYHFFLRKYDAYISPVCDTYAYCLLGNHFHLLIRVRPLEDLSTFQELTNPNNKPQSPHEIVSHQFRKFFQSYAMAYNKQQDRVGTLFQTPFKRALVETDAYFTQLIYYIHSNPQHHGLISDFREWPYSSYERMLIEKPSKLRKKEVLDWFGTTELYKQYHHAVHTWKLDSKLVLEE